MDWASEVALAVKTCLPMQVRCERHRFDPLEEGMAIHSSILFFFHSSILAWRIPWAEEHGRLQSTGSQIVGHN